MSWDFEPYEGDMKFELYRSGGRDPLVLDFSTPKNHQIMNLQNALSKLGIVTQNVRIEENSIYTRPSIYIEGYLDNNAAFVGEKIGFTVSDFIRRSMTTIEYFINKVIFNPPATVILWADGTKTVVKCGEHDEFDPEKGLVMAITKKLLGNKGNYYNNIKRLLKEAEYQYDEDDVYDLSIPKTVVKKIRWKHRDDYDPLKYKETYFECPLCGDEILKSGARYCANCGQRLIWEEK